MDLPANGWIEDQDEDNEDYFPRAGTGWIWNTSTYDGSDTIAELQRRLDIEVDGIAGPDTVSALQHHLRNRGHELDVDGYCGYRTVECLQYELVNGTLWG